MTNHELTFNELSRANEVRAKKWHQGGLDRWSPSDWGVALAGEVGECCNAIKKWNRVRDNISNVSDEGRAIEDEQAAIEKIGEELADTVHYAFLLASRLGIDLEKEVIDKFNAVSVKYGFPDRL